MQFCQHKARTYLTSDLTLQCTGKGEDRLPGRGSSRETWLLAMILWKNHGSSKLRGGSIENGNILAWKAGKSRRV